MTTSNSQPPFYQGQRVVCVDDDWPNRFFDGKGIVKKGDIITVEEMEFYKGLWYIVTISDDIAYAAYHFAPIIESYTDIRESLAQEALQKVHDTADRPIKEFINSN